MILKNNYLLLIKKLHACHSELAKNLVFFLIFRDSSVADSLRKTTKYLFHNSKHLNTLFAIFFLFVFLAVPVLTFAQIPQNPFNPPLQPNDQKIGKAGFTLERLISSIARMVNWFSWFIAVVAVAMGLYAAFLYLTARGDAKQISDAHKTLIYAIIGITVAILAFSIVTITRTFLNL